VRFSDHSTLGTEGIETWHWDFGDGTQSSAQHPEHTYTVPGTYSVSLTVTRSTTTESITQANLIVAETSAPAEVSLSHPHGFYAAPFELTLSTRLSNGSIRYTLDGTPPSATEGTLYTAPITLSSTTTLRAVAYAPGIAPATVRTATYLFLGDIVTQFADGQAPPGWPATPVNGQIVDYGMDPRVTADPRYADLMEEAMTAIPSLSIVTDLDNLMDPTTGIQVNARQRGRDWERPMSLELLDPEGNETFQIDAGIRIRGGWSRRGTNVKHAFRLFFRGEYGATKLRFPLFGDEGVDEFDKIDLRTSNDFSWHNSDRNDDALSELAADLFTYGRDVFSRDTQRDMGQPYTRSRFYHLYLNGVYWGVYQSQERSEKEYAETYFGGTADDYDVIKNGDELIDGDTVAWQALWQAMLGEFNTDANYYGVQGLNPDGSPHATLPKLIDIDNLIDYMLVIYYTANFDAPVSWFYTDNEGTPNAGLNNIWAIYNRSNPDGFKFFLHDSGVSMVAHSTELGSFLPDGDHSNPHQDRTGPYLHPNLLLFQNNNPQTIHQRLLAHPEYQMRFADRVQRHFFNEGALTPTATTERFLIRANQIDRAIIGESARFGDIVRGAENPPRTRDDDWLAAVDGVVDTLLPTRTAVVLEQLKGQGWFPDVRAPRFLVNGVRQHGGAFAANAALSLSNPNSGGTLYYTLDGSDPRLPAALDEGGMAAVNPSAQIYTDALTLSQNTWVRARVQEDGVWSALSEAVFVPDDLSDRVRITEIMFHPADAPVGHPDAEFIELKNIGTSPVNLYQLAFTDGIRFTFPDQTLQPGMSTVLVKDETAFASVYGAGISIAGSYSGQLNNDGERVVLEDGAGNVLHDFRYGERWYDLADGGGYSLQILEEAGDPLSDWNTSRNWRSSSRVGGSPGSDDEHLIPAPGSVVINEILAHSHDEAPDWIELYNTSEDAIDLSGWFLSDSANNLQKYELPAGSVINAGAYLVFYEDEHFNNESTASPFALSENGETVYLSSASNGTLTGYRDREDFGASATGVSFGRYATNDDDINFPPLSIATPGSANGAPAQSPLVITEIMYDPGSNDSRLEYVELYNYTNTPIALYDEEGIPWRFTAGMDYSFPANTTIAPFSYMIVVKDLDAFENTYDVGNNATVLGPFGGQLSDGEALELSQPGDTDELGTQYFIRLDRVRYDSKAPWPPSADGEGDALHRINRTVYGNDATNWEGAAPSPGE